MSPLVVSPDLVRGSRDKAATPAAEAADKSATPQGSATEKPAATKAAPAQTTGSAAEVRPVRPAGDDGAAVVVPVQPRPSAGATGQVVRPEQTQAPVAAPAPQPSAATPAPGGTEIRAMRISGTRAVEMVADGDAELHRGEMVLSADKLTYREPTDEALADGNVRLREGQNQVTGPSAQLVIGEQVGEFQSPAYRITRERPALVEGEPPRVVSGSGQADVMYFEGENHYRLENATWSTCTPDDPDWYIKARDLQLDYDREIGTANGGTVVFKDVPLLWTPWAEFPLAGQRQSGLLAPTFGTSNKTGLDLSVPYYWNIAPNYDATIAPRYMSRRGLQLAIEGRYLGETYKGEARVEWLSRDNVSGEERSLGSWQHQQWLTPQLYASFDVNGVSDDEYFEDLSTRISVASKVNLVREGRLMYVGGDWWSAAALVQSYQTLNADPDVTYTTPYRRLPQLTLNANRPDLIGGLTANFQSEYVKFAHPNEGMPEGTRVIAYPSLSLPIQQAGYYITPKIGVHQTQYDLDRGLPGGRDSITRTVPIYSVDAGMTFERDINLFGNDYVQTLEPRLYYLNVPYRRQDDIPLFDTSRFDFGFAQIFSENLYTGGDRIADANQITAAVTTRLIDPVTGGERLRALIGQRYYFEDQRVTLNQLGGSVVEEPRTGRRADILAGFSGHFNRENSLDSLIQYNPRDNWTERFNIVYRYQPDFAKALNLSYRYARDILRDVDVSGQWPLGGGWYGVTRLTHSLKDDRLTEAIAGLEYDGGCWVFRVAAHRFATNSEDTTQAFFIQLELNDLASIGTSPVSLIKRSVPGYGTINDPVANRVFGFD